MGLLREAKLTREGAEFNPSSSVSRTLRRFRSLRAVIAVTASSDTTKYGCGLCSKPSSELEPGAIVHVDASTIVIKPARARHHSIACHGWKQ
jgi:hypothetical protein